MDFCSAHPSIVRSVKQRDLLNTWLRLARGRANCAPPETQFRPGRIEEEKPDLVWYRIEWNGDAPTIIINSDGARVARAYGNGGSNKGRRLEDFLGPAKAVEVMPVYDACIRRGRPIFTKSTVYDVFGHRVYYERLLLPFSEERAVTSIIAGARNGRSPRGRVRWRIGRPPFERR